MDEKTKELQKGISELFEKIPDASFYIIADYKDENGNGRQQRSYRGYNVFELLGLATELKDSILRQLRGEEKTAKSVDKYFVEKD